MITRRHALAIATLAGTTHMHSWAQEWAPSKPITIYVPYPAGGLLDVIARKIGNRLTTSLKVPVIVINRPGANTMIAAAAVAKADADGHALLFTTDASVTINPYLYKRIAYDAERDFTPVTMVSNTVECLIAHPKVPASTVPEFFAWAKREGKKINYGSYGIGSNAHLATSELELRLGTEFNHVPYKGQADLYQALLTNDIQFVIGTTGIAAQYISDGKLKLIAPLRSKRAPLFPNVASATEQGVPMESGGAWFGFLAPAGTPSAAVQRLTREISLAAQDREFQLNQMIKLGLEPSEMGSKVMGHRLAQDRRHYGPLIKRLQISLD